MARTGIERARAMVRDFWATNLSTHLTGLEADLPSLATGGLPTPADASFMDWDPTYGTTVQQPLFIVRNGIGQPDPNQSRWSKVIQALELSITLPITHATPELTQRAADRYLQATLDLFCTVGASSLGGTRGVSNVEILRWEPINQYSNVYGWLLPMTMTYDTDNLPSE